jgi:hypothetical protein
MAAKDKLLNVYSAWQFINQYEIETGVDGLTEFSGVWAYTPTQR